MSHNMSHKMSHIKPIKVQVCEEDYCNQIGSEDEFMPSVECELPVDPTETTTVTPLTTTTPPTTPVISTSTSFSNWTTETDADSPSGISDEAIIRISIGISIILILPVTGGVYFIKKYKKSGWIFEFRLI